MHSSNETSQAPTGPTCHNKDHHHQAGPLRPERARIPGIANLTTNISVKRVRIIRRWLDGPTIAVQPNYVAASTMTPRPPRMPSTIT